MTHTFTFAELELNVKAKVYDKGNTPLQLQEHFANGKIGGQEFDICMSVPGRTLLIELGEKMYEVEIKAVMNALMDKLEKEKSK